MEFNKSSPKSNVTTKRKKTLFSFGDYSKYHIFLFLVPLFHMMSEYVQRDIIIENEKSRGENEKVSEFFRKYELSYLAIAFISKLFSGFLYIISIYLIYKEEFPYKLLKTKSIRIYHLNVNAKNKCKILLHIILISFLEVLFKIESISTLKKKYLIDIKLGFTIFIPILSYIFLKFKYYRHHFVSTIIGLFGFIFIVLSLLFVEPKERVPFSTQLIHFLSSFPFSLSIIMIKYMFIHYFIGPFAFLFIDGLLCIVFSFIYIIIKFILILNDIELVLANLKNLFVIFKSKKIFLLFICIIILTFIYLSLKSISLYFFSPAVFVMTDILSPVFTWIIDFIYNMIKNREDIYFWYSIFKSIGYIFLIFACIIFNEVIICHFWKLDYYTIKKIEERGIEDVVKETSNIISANESITSDL